MVVVMTGRTHAFASLQARFDAIASGRLSGDSTALHNAILAHLAENQAGAVAAGWTEVALTRLGGTGKLYVEGTSPAMQGRDRVPDSLGASYAASGSVDHVGAEFRSKARWSDDGGQ
ncbi:MAG TPA: hypothetical protein VJ717_15740 [Gemmatimonadaceae bacterium]|nr:hypothetical protein [Gemmatimonadaceae bacterium]